MNYLVIPKQSGIFFQIFVILSLYPGSIPTKDFHNASNLPRNVPNTILSILSFVYRAQDSD